MVMAYLLVLFNYRVCCQHLNEAAPEAYHKFCLRHLYAYWKKDHKGKKPKDLMWEAANKTTKAEFEAVMGQLKGVSLKAYQDVVEDDPSLWAQHAFTTFPECDTLLNNLRETFNCKIVNAKGRPILVMMEKIKRYLTTSIRTNRDAMMKHKGPVCPKRQQKLELNKNASRHCKSCWSGGTCKPG